MTRGIGLSTRLVFACLCCTCQSILEVSAWCDVTTVASCLLQVPDLPSYETVFNNATTSLVQPCQTFVEYENNHHCIDKMDECGKYQDLVRYVHELHSFCINVSTCDNFAHSYLISQTCHTSMLNNIVSSVSSDFSCKLLETCLQRTLKCEALHHRAHLIWSEFKMSCQKAGVETIFEPGFNPQPQCNNNECQNLFTVSRKIDQCHADLVTQINASAADFQIIDVHHFCSSINSFVSCFTNIDPAETFDLHMSTDEILLPLVDSSTLLCGDSQDLTDVCNIGGFGGCLHKLDRRLWQIEALILQASSNSTNDHTHLRLEHLQRILESVELFCNEISEKTLQAEICLQDNLSGCSPSIYKAFSQGVHFVEKFCQQIEVCSHSSTTPVFDTCRHSSHQEMIIQASDVEQCREHEDFLSCFQMLLMGCPGQTAEVELLLELLQQQFEPICPNNTKITYNHTFTVSRHLQCRDAIQISRQISSLTTIMLRRLLQNPTNTDEICQGIKLWRWMAINQIQDSCPTVAKAIYNHAGDILQDFAELCNFPTISTFEFPEFYDFTTTPFLFMPDVPNSGCQLTSKWILQSLTLSVLLLCIN